MAICGLLTLTPRSAPRMVVRPLLGRQRCGIDHQTNVCDHASVPIGPEQVLALLTEEYKTLRAQVVSDLDRQYSIANWGISAFAVVTVAIFSAWDKLRFYPNVLIAMLLLAAPTVVTSYVLAWAHVLRSTLRAGRQLYQIEEHVALLITAETIRSAYHLTNDEQVEAYRHVLSWEHSLRPDGAHALVRPAVRLIGVALAVAYVGTLLGGVAATSRLRHHTISAAVFRPEILGAIALWVGVWVIVVTYVRKAHRIPTQ
jgi:hypothetical protein